MPYSPGTEFEVYSIYNVMAVAVPGKQAFGSFCGFKY